jgi:hypothetical protein
MEKGEGITRKGESWLEVVLLFSYSREEGKKNKQK